MPGMAIYVGPWLPSISNTIDIEVTPVTGTDISIILAEDATPTTANVYQISELKYYINFLNIRKARERIANRVVFFVAKILLMLLLEKVIKRFFSNFK